ncbi:MAG TPA: hypothetical protein VFO39_08075 [Candidatus Sulfotelmatobacter sp.]|nr:hypothetical protein [Candidatus Sulfotelmatobacter sp.]
MPTRPLGVTLLALFFFLITVVLLGVLVVSLFHPEGISTRHPTDLQHDIQQANKYKGAHLLIVLTFAAVGFGLWNLHPLARYAVLVLTGVSLAWRIVGLLLWFGLHRMGHDQDLGVLFWIGTLARAGIFLYLKRADIKEAFTKATIQPSLAAR